MRMSRPSPGTVLATIALVMASTGTAVAAVDFARNAGAVDRLSAVGAGSTNNHAAGNLVATARGGSNKGQIPNKFLADVPETTTFAAPFDVQDNATGANVDLSRTAFGTLTASCQDQANAAATEDPRTVISFTNTSGGGLNYARRVGAGDATINLIQTGTVDSFTINGSNTFRYHVQGLIGQLVVEGAVRQDRPTPTDGKCLVWGTVQVVR
jgi:hypothetical protein